MSDSHRYLEALQPLTMRLGLARMERALAALGHPERGPDILHVAGTNGKGSTCAMAAHALHAAGHRTGLYTSPHLHRFNERIAVDGHPIPDEALARHLAAVREACPWHDAASGARSFEDDRLTYFEMATLLAFLHFRAEGCRAVVLEVGLGGRFDATNVVRPLACAVARIGLDHTALLGSTLDAIAREKAGIFKPGVPAALTSVQPPEALAALRDEAARRGAPIELAPPDVPGAVGLPGPHQRANAALAATALRLLDGRGLSVPEEAIAAGLAGARWPGRLEEIGGVLLDGAHNPDGAEALAASLRALHPGRPVELVFGVLADKDHEPMLRALSSAVRAFHLVAPDSPRARAPRTYVDRAAALGGRADVHASVAEALDCARASAGTDGLVCAAGSLYLVGEARRLLGAA